MNSKKTSKTSAVGGFSYYVSDEQMQAFAGLSPLQRLQWLDEARRFTLLGRTPITAERQERLRRGELIEK